VWGLVRFVNVTAFSVLAKNELAKITEGAPLCSRLVHPPNQAAAAAEGNFIQAGCGQDISLPISRGVLSQPRPLDLLRLPLDSTRKDFCVVDTHAIVESIRGLRKPFQCTC
jgi:hypothetical protein